jgi:hypothetical protein
MAYIIVVNDKEILVNFEVHRILNENRWTVLVGNTLRVGGEEVNRRICSQDGRVRVIYDFHRDP